MTPSLDGRRFTEAGRVLVFREDREGTVTATYVGGTVAAGSLAGRRDGAVLDFGFSQVERNGVVTVGTAQARLEVLDDGRLRVHETWQTAGGTGTSTLEELPGPRWLKTRAAHPSGSLAAAAAFYGGLLGLDLDGPHDAAPYELLIVQLPGGAQLEQTSGVCAPVAGTDEDLLVLYVPTRADVAGLRERVVAAGLELVRVQNPYWSAMGFAVRDPDGRLVVVAHSPA